MPRAVFLAALVVVALALPWTSLPSAAQSACACASSESCLLAARQLRVADVDAARSCYERACELGDGGACRELADTVPWDQPDVDERQLSLATDAATRGCTRGNEQSCGILISLFLLQRDRLHDGEVIAPAERLCAKGSAAICFQLGVAWLEREAGPASWPKARRYLERACTAKLPDACAALAAVYAFGDEERGLSPSPRKANRLWWRACDLGRASACERGARLESAGEPSSFKPAAVRFLRRGCALQSQWSCAYLRDRECGAGDDAACQALAAIELGSCERRCRRWHGEPNHEDRACAEWGSTCDDERDAAKRSLQSALAEIARECFERDGGPTTVRVDVALSVLVTGRVRVRSVSLSPAASDVEHARECVRARLSAVRTSGLREAAPLRLVLHHRSR